jgi:hypothetical protein
MRIPMSRQHVIVLALALSSTLPLRAQSTSTTAATCAWDACALRIEENKVLQGIEGREVGKLSLFKGVKSVAWTSDSARQFASRAQSSHSTGLVFKTLGFAASIAGAVILFKGEETSTHDVNGATTTTTTIKKSDLYTGIGLGIGAAVLGAIGEVFDGRARKFLSRAVWWNNREIAR